MAIHTHKNHKFIKNIISLVLVVALLACTPYLVENANAIMEKHTKTQSAKSVVSQSSKPSTSKATVSKSSTPKATASKSSTPKTATSKSSTPKPSSSKSAASAPKVIPLISMKPVLQGPELSSGCEVSSLTAVLNFDGYDIDKVTLAVFFLETDNTSTTQNGKTYRPSPWKVFVGYPELDCYGCFAPVIVQTANHYLTSVNSKKRAVNLTGAQPSKLYEYVSNHIPVIVWATKDMVKSSCTTTWYDRDTKKLFEWPSQEHCMVLLADTDTTVTMCDPTKGIVTYDKKTFEERYKELYQQAIIIQ